MRTSGALLRLFWWSWGGDRQNFQDYVHPHSVVIIAQNHMEVNLKSFRQMDANLELDCNPCETISSIVILLSMFCSVQLQYRPFTPIQQFSIIQYTGLALSRRRCCKRKNAIVPAQGECLHQVMYRGEPEQTKQNYFGRLP